MTLPRRALLLAALLLAPAAALVAAAPVAAADTDRCAPLVLTAYACVATRNDESGHGAPCDAAPARAERDATVVVGYGAVGIALYVRNHCATYEPGGYPPERVLRVSGHARASSGLTFLQIEWYSFGGSCAFTAVVESLYHGMPCPMGTRPPLLPALP